MQTHDYDFQSADVRDQKSAARKRSCVFAALTACMLCALCALNAGCDTLKNQECCLTKPGGIFASKDDEVERLSTRNEEEAIMRATSASERKSVWEPTESELRYAKEHDVDLKKYVWAAQRPNGGVLFPRRLLGRGPIVVMEPSVISAPVGSDIVLVASYVGEDSQYLRVGERLSWNMSGVGQFMSTNPNNGAACLQCPWSDTSRKVEGRSQETETSGQLYKITRGTDSIVDDITILRGQSWMAVTSYEEGTSSVSVTGENIQNWNNRRASAQIHWVDAAFLYPESAVGPVDRAGQLETSVIRRSNAEPRVDWPVKYEVISGEGGFDVGDGKLIRSALMPTDGQGKSRVLIGQGSSKSGTTKVKVSIYRPGTEAYPEAVVDSRTIHYTWTTAAPLAVQVIAPSSAKAGDELRYEIVVNNYSEFFYRTTIDIEIPQGTKLINITPPISTQADPQKRLTWTVENIMPNSSYSVDLYLKKEFDGNVPLRVQLRNSAPTETPTNARPSYPNQTNSAVKPPTSNANPAVSPNL